MLRSDGSTHGLVWMSRRVLIGIGACAALTVSAAAVGWLIKSSQHADRPPLYAVVAFILAVAAGAVGLSLTIRAVRGPRRRF